MNNQIIKFGINLALFMTCACATLCPMLEAKESTLTQTSQDFTSVAKEAIPAVVSIRVKTPAKQKNSSLHLWGFHDDDSGNLFGDDFFQRKQVSRHRLVHPPNMRILLTLRKSHSSQNYALAGRVCQRVR